MVQIHNQTWCFGWTSTEVSMWVSCTVIWLLGISVVTYEWSIDPARLAFFSSPAWITAIWGPSQRVPSLQKVVCFAVIMFLAYWSVLQVYPCQCRSAWGTQMVTDAAYWGNMAATNGAVQEESDIIYPMQPTRLLLRELFHGKQMSTGTDVHRRLQIQQETTVNDKLRAYCNMHQDDVQLPHIYPLRILGITPRESNFTAPCPYWTCVLTEASSHGKLPFVEFLAGAVLLNYAHFRLDWTIFVHMLGSGQFRLWWIWFWASFLPLWCVMLIKTTHEGELSAQILLFFDHVSAFVMDSPQRMAIGLSVVLGFVVLFIFKDRVRRELGLDEFLAPFIPQGKLTEHTFQVCIWRVDIHAHKTLEHFHQVDANHEDSKPADSSAKLEDIEMVRSFIPLRLVGGVSAPWGIFRKVSSYLPDFGEGDALRTSDGHAPALCVRLCYGSKEIQSTRARRLTYSQWLNDAAVDFHENFTLTVQPTPHALFKVEVRDKSIGSIPLGHVSFDERQLWDQFRRSQKMEEKNRAKLSAGATADEQVLQMMQQRCSDSGDAEKMSRMWEAGFAPHRLSAGGAIWLAFSEIEIGRAHV